MEQHPVPQNVTTFQFRLIGDMTIKQFGYLAGGVILAFICYKLPLPFFFTWPLTVIAALGGFGFAFVPIEERPMDIWIAAFFKNVYSPTQYIWQKTKPPAPPAGQKPPPLVVPTAAAAVTVVPTVPQPVASPLPAKPQEAALPVTQPQQQPSGEAATPKHHTVSRPFQFHLPAIDFGAMMAPLFDLFASRAPKMPQARSVSAATPHLPVPGSQPKTTLQDIFANVKTPSVTGRRLDVSTGGTPSDKPKLEAKIIQDQQTEATTKINKLESSLTQLQKELHSKPTDQSHIVELQTQLAKVLSDKEAMERELVTLRQQMAKPAAVPQVTRPAGVVAPSPSQPSVRVIAAEGAIHAGLPKLTTFPNVVTGIIKDNTGNLLTGVLVTVRDKDDVPLRALKSNKLGQFAASTPLPNGTYVVEIEDPRGSYAFDRVQITLNGGLIPAIEVTARSQKQIAREKLAHEIFGNTNL